MMRKTGNNPGRPHILVIEDEYYLADDIVAALQDAGADVMGPVATIAQGLALLETQPAPDLAVLDINLRGDPVYPLATELRRRGVPFVFATGYDQSAIPDDFSAVRRIEKPFDLSRLLDELAAELPAFRLAQASGSGAIRDRPTSAGRTAGR